MSGNRCFKTSERQSSVPSSPSGRTSHQGKLQDGGHVGGSEVCIPLPSLFSAVSEGATGEEEDAGHLGDDEDDTQKERNQKTSNSHNTDTPQTVQSLCSTANGRHSYEESRASCSHLVLQGNPPHFI